MFSLKSFFMRTIFLQVFSILILWLIIVGWIKYFYYPNLGKYYNNQQRIVAQGIANILNDIKTTHKEHINVIRHIEYMYIDSVNNDMMESINYRPLLIVYDQENHVIYASPPLNAPLDLPPTTEVCSVVYAGIKWHIVSTKNIPGKYRVVIGESFADRRILLGSPIENTAIPLLASLLAIIVTLFITAYFSLLPLRRTAKIISNRDPSNLSPINIHAQYQEIRPIMVELNQLMARICAANQREKRFMADAAHELRTPIAAVLAQLHLLTLVRDKDEQQEIIEDMQQGLNRAGSLSRQLIDLARLESENCFLKIEPINLYTEISTCIARHVPHALEKNIELSLDGCERVIINSDRQSILAIFTNLLNNAIKYTPENGRIEVNVRTIPTLGHFVILRDNGPGVSREAQKHLFERFYRVPGVQQSGSGLGLAISKNLANKIGAQIRIVKGLDQRGIGFIIILPESITTPELLPV